MMADTIKCSVCGEINPADLEFCQNCQSRLQPLTGPLRGENAPISPGQAPTKKVTSELEPILPQWLRDARQQARRSAEEEAVREEEQQKAKPAPRGPDLLAGLASQGEEEDEDMPDWLANITGSPAKKKKAEPEEMQVKRVELGRDEMSEPAPSDEENAVPSWMTPQEPAPEKDELSDWFKQASAPASSFDSQAAPIEPAFSEPAPSSTFNANDADWLKNLDSGNVSAAEIPASESPASNESPDWLKNLDAGASAVPPQPPTINEPPVPAQVDVPDWLKSFGSETPAAPSAEAMPDWLKAAAPSGEVPQAIQPEPPSEEESASSEMPDWLSSLKPAASQPSAPSEPAAPALTPQEPKTPSAPSAFTEDAMSSQDVDAIFSSMQMPDWLTSVTPASQTTEENLPPAAQSEEAITPAELPSWVQAMRPVEAAMPESSTGGTDAELETRGPLAGLHGVLPSIPGVATPSSKPKAHSIKLNASEEQQAHAALLEQILAAETSPVPMKGGSVLTSQRVLRWLITVLLGLALAGASFAGTQIFPLPADVPIETSNAIAAIEAVPPDAPVLVVFDYEPSTVGEMEASGASLMDHLLLLKHPHLILISTSPTGPALAERFMSTVLAQRNYQAGIQYFDLGYLPGGLAGVYDFARNPTAFMPLSGGDSTALAFSNVSQGATRLSDFAAIIVLTDKLESGRIWIEQSASTRGNASMILISSAQAGPMFLPYVDSGQVNGMVAGLNGAVGAEQANGGQPNSVVRRYWDAYSLGLLFAVVMILLGGLWNFVLGLRDRRAQEGS